MQRPYQGRRSKSIQERAEEFHLNKTLSEDLARMMGIGNDPVAMEKFRADAAAGDNQKYSMGASGSLEEALDSPITPQNQCNFCDREGTAETLSRCGQCKIIKYCDRDCQTKDWRFHKVDCALLQRSPKNLVKNGGEI